ncbi:uncharacterized protein LOC62_02G002470 [Vanrija pseudolonga]|uniref:Uncharacterized protein n=1 Tax=Vanrija pseudolonga TaxID=143232 RepID=A0AAF0Y3U5_9TREE|nr:hypothetical protein LOC62_02G002470 [Vanrija pseudolonga]
MYIMQPVFASCPPIFAFTGHLATRTRCHSRSRPAHALTLASRNAHIASSGCLTFAAGLLVSTLVAHTLPSRTPTTVTPSLTTSGTMSASAIATIISQNPEFVTRCIAALNTAEHYLSPLYRPDPLNDRHRHSHDIQAMHEHAAVLNSFVQMASARIHKFALQQQLDNIINGTVRARSVTFAAKLPRNKGIASEEMLQDRRAQFDAIAERHENDVANGLGHRLVDIHLERNVRAVVALLVELAELIDATKPSIAQPAPLDEWVNAPKVTAPLVPKRYNRLTDEQVANFGEPKVPRCEPRALHRQPAHRDLRTAAATQ